MELVADHQYLKKIRDHMLFVDGLIDYSAAIIHKRMPYVIKD